MWRADGPLAAYLRGAAVPGMRDSAAHGQSGRYETLPMRPVFWVLD